MEQKINTRNLSKIRAKMKSARASEPTSMKKLSQDEVSDDTIVREILEIARSAKLSARSSGSSSTHQPLSAIDILKAYDQYVAKHANIS